MTIQAVPKTVETARAVSEATAIRETRAVVQPAALVREPVAKKDVPATVHGTESGVRAVRPAHMDRATVILVALAPSSETTAVTARSVGMTAVARAVAGRMPVIPGTTGRTARATAPEAGPAEIAPTVAAIESVRPETMVAPTLRAVTAPVGRTVGLRIGVKLARAVDVRPRTALVMIEEAVPSSVMIVAGRGREASAVMIEAARPRVRTSVTTVATARAVRPIRATDRPPASVPSAVTPAMVIAGTIVRAAGVPSTGMTVAAVAVRSTAMTVAAPGAGPRSTGATAMVVVRSVAMTVAAAVRSAVTIAAPPAAEGLTGRVASGSRADARTPGTATGARGVRRVLPAGAIATIVGAVPSTGTIVGAVPTTVEIAAPARSTGLTVVTGAGGRSTVMPVMPVHSSAMIVAVVTPARSSATIAVIAGRVRSNAMTAGVPVRGRSAVKAVTTGAVPTRAVRCARGAMSGRGRVAVTIAGPVPSSVMTVGVLVRGRSAVRAVRAVRAVTTGAAVTTGGVRGVRPAGTTGRPGREAGTALVPGITEAPIPTPPALARGSAATEAVRSKATRSELPGRSAPRCRSWQPTSLPRSWRRRSETSCAPSPTISRA